jgi:hypothetical protein
MKRFLRWVGFLALSIVIGELAKRVLASRAGSAAATKLGRPELATLEGAASLGKEARRAVGLVKTLTGPKPAVVERPLVAVPRTAGWLGLARDASEMLLAAGALMKVAADFAGEDEKLQKKIKGTAR